jgi:hypothetical protein
MRWKDEREEIIELVYRIRADHDGSIPEREVRKFAPWAANAIKRARKIRWLTSKGAPPVLSITNKGARALDTALASRGIDAPRPHWFGGLIASVSSPTGPILPAQSYEPYEELKSWALKQGILTQEDIERITRSKKREPEEPQEYRMLEELSFPGTLVFAASLRYEDNHPLGGGWLDPVGHEGAYQVTVTLTRRGAPDVSFAYVTDAYMMEGDSHLWLLQDKREDGAVGVPLLMYGTPEGGTIEFQLLANQQGRLGQIRTVLRAGNADDARRKAYRILNPFLCDLSFRYDVPLEVLQTNVAEIATHVLSGMKHNDFRERVFDPEQFLGSGLNYGELPNYEFFMRLYREGANSSSVDYGFLCFFRIAEGVIQLRRTKIMEQEGKTPGEVPRSDVFLEEEIVDGEGADDFPPEMQGESLWKVYKELEKKRNGVGHAFLYHEDPVAGHAEIIADRLEGEEQAEFATDLDGLENIVCWYRNADKGEFALQGHRRAKFNPDFIAFTESGKIAVLEWKGADRTSNEDTRHKDALGGDWASLDPEHRYFAVVGEENHHEVVREVANL